MVMIEFKEAALDRAFELLEESKKSTKHTKLALCELEDVLCDALKEDEDYYDPYDEESESMIGLRRSRSGMRDDMHEYGYRRGMRMRRNRMGRYAY